MISLLSKGLSRVFSNTTVQKHQFFSAQPCFTSPKTTGKTLTSLHDHQKNHSFDYMDFCGQSGVSAFEYSKFVIAFFPRSKSLLISWLQSPSTVILKPKKIKSGTASTFSPSVCHDVMGLDVTILVFLNVEFQARFFTFLFHLHQEAL